MPVLILWAVPALSWSAASAIIWFALCTELS